ncbi:signal peptidase II [Salinicola rhizosphaerae]|uniref:Lipoprotein signal peptidase n=1 Tax=Salinicola rhizosphaerae TaxID=1443141 RepID=A0ABQ3ECP9_9GAMM|nr:signal peptidase II [Salinicola rhizosphaerae]GHB33539.1 lipoprotein signal peptidase [Salinicola rhizosphaerae]
MPRPLRWLWLSLAVILLDLGIKALASANLEYGRPLEILPIFNLTLLHNTGAAFSFLAEHAGWQRWLFALIAIGASIGLTVWLTRLKRGEVPTAISLALVIGGAIGNLYDRLVHGYVVDYLSFHWGPHYYPAFNLADSAITLGAVGLILQSFFDSRRTKTPDQGTREKS